MTKTSKRARQRITCLAIVCLVMGIATTAFAVPPNQVLRSTDPLQFPGACCFSFDETVSVTEPATPKPVVVTWSAELTPSRDFAFAGLMLNGGACQFYGSGFIRNNDSFFQSRTFQWIIFPSDGLRAGTNTFTLCGGGGSSNQGTLFVNSNTLAVRLSK